MISVLKWTSEIKNGGQKKHADANTMPSNHQARMQEYRSQETLIVSLQGNLKLRTAGILKKARPMQTIHSGSQHIFSLRASF